MFGRFFWWIASKFISSAGRTAGHHVINSDLKMEMESLHEMFEKFHTLTTLSSLEDVIEQRARQRIMCACQMDSCSTTHLHPFYYSLREVWLGTWNICFYCHFKTVTLCFMRMSFDKKEIIMAKKDQPHLSWKQFTLITQSTKSYTPINRTFRTHAGCLATTFWTLFILLIVPCHFLMGINLSYEF